MSEAGLYGKPVADAALEEEGYEPHEDYSDQGDERVIRDLMFSYVVVGKDPAGDDILLTTEARRGDKVTVGQIGLLALKHGEENHSFYTTEELERMERGGGETEAVSAEANISEMGEYELAEWLATDNPDTGRAWTINEVLEKVGDDKELAHRMIQAENIRDPDHPRAGLETGLQTIISSS